MAELLSNTTFDVNTTSWTPVNTATIDSVAGGESNNCLRITEDDTAADPGAYQDITTVIGNTYALSAYVKAGTEATYDIIASETDGSNATQIGPLEATGAWVRKGMAFVATATTTRILLQQGASKGAGTTILFDEVSVDLIEFKGRRSLGLSPTTT